MAAPIKPALKQALGKDSWSFVVAVATITAPTAIELSASSGFNFSCSSFSDQGGISSTTAKVTLPRLLCERTTYQVGGPTNYDMADLMITFQPQAAAATAGKKAWETMTDYLNGFLWFRQDIDATTDIVAGQYVNVFPCQLLAKTPTKSGTGDEAVYSFKQAVSVTGSPAYNVLVL